MGGQTELLGQAIAGQTVLQPVGEDLSGLIYGKNQQAPGRPGVLFTTDDPITELPPGSGPNNPAIKQPQYNVFLQEVENVRNQGVDLTPGSVRQPNRVRCLCTGDWKLARYTDPNGQEPDEYELYNLALDPAEAVNLVNYQTFAVRTDVSLPGLTVEQITAQRDTLRAQLASEEARLL